MFYRLTKYLNLPRYETLYSMWDWKNLTYRSKIGISQDHEIRKGDIETSVREKLGMRVNLSCVGLPVLFARRNEKLAHWIFKKLKYNGLKESNGGSEYFWTFNFLTCLLSLILLSRYDLSPAYAGIVFIAPLPLDHWFVIITLALFQYAVLFALFYGAYCFIT